MSTRRRYLIIMVALVGLAAAAVIVIRSKNRSGEQSDYRDAEVKRARIEVNVLATGVVQPENRLEIKSPIAGRAERVLVEEGQRVRSGQTLLWMSSSERAALLDAARAHGPEELQKWQELYRPAPILAPISGTIILRKIEAGQTFATSDVVFVMSDRLSIQAQVDETDIGQIRVGESATIFLDAYPDQKIQGKVDKVSFEAKTVNNVTTYIATIVPNSVPDFMRSGMTANVTFNVATKEDVLTIPAEALKVHNGSKFVVTSKPTGGSLGETAITTGITDGKAIEVLSGLNEGDRILIPKIGNFLKGKNSGANPFGGPMSNAPPKRGGGGH